MNPNNKPKQRLRRPCTTCGNYFIPTGKGCRLCVRCLKKSHMEREKIRWMKSQKEEMKND